MSIWRDICIFYDNLTLHLVPGPRSISYTVPPILIITTLLTPPRLLSRQWIHWLVLPLIYAIQFYVWTVHESFDVISMDAALAAFMLLGWYDVRKDFKYARRLHLSTTAGLNDADTHDVLENNGRNTKLQAISSNSQTPFVLDPYPAAFVPRLKWVGMLLASTRLTDWHIGVASHDAQQPSPLKPFADFALETVVQGTLAYTLLDLTTPYMVARGCCRYAVDVRQEPFSSHLTGSLVMLAYFYAALSLFTAFLPHLLSICALFVAPALRVNPMASPLTWPGHFGPFSSIYSRSSKSHSRHYGLRAFWGTFWHQNMRHITSTPGLALASAVGLSRGSRLRYMIIVASSFFWSGVVHMGVIPPRPLGTELGCWEMRFMLASFFWLQVVGVGMEELFEAIQNVKVSRQIHGSDTDNPGQLHGSSGKPPLSPWYPVEIIVKGLILTWTVGFLAFTAWWTVLPVGCEMGWWNLRLLPVSYTKYLNFFNPL